MPAKAGWQVSCSPCHSGVGWVLPGQLTFLAVVDRRAYVSSLYFTIFDPTLPRRFDKSTVSQRYIIQRTKTSSCKFVYNTLVVDSGVQRVTPESEEIVIDMQHRGVNNNFKHFNVGEIGEVRALRQLELVPDEGDEEQGLGDVVHCRVICCRTV